MLSENGEWVECNVFLCPERVKNHKWGRIKAQGWLFTKDGRHFCPRHLPAWYTKWHNKNKENA